MIDDGGMCTFLEVDGDIPYLVPGERLEDEVITENRDRLLGHLESLIKQTKGDPQEKDKSNPKATAGEEVEGHAIGDPEGRQ